MTARNVDLPTPEVLKNPVPMHDSLDALDLMARVLPVLRKAKADPNLITAVADQKIRHWRKLQHLIGDEALKEDYST